MSAQHLFRNFTLASAMIFSGWAATADVNVYSYRQPELIAPLTDAFTAETGIAVNVVFLDKGLAERLKAEGRRSPADLVFTVDISRLNAIVETGMTAPVISKELNAQIPAALRDPSGHWFGLTTRARVIYASKDRVQKGALQTYEELSNPKWQGRICSRSGTHAYNIALTSAYLYHHGTEATKAWLEGVKQNLARKPQGNDRAQVKAIWAGECDIAIGNTYYMGKMLADSEQTAWANSVDIIFPKFEQGGTHMNVSGVALTKYAPNREEALQLMMFLASSRAQKIYAEINYEYPATPGVDPSELVRSWGAFDQDDVNLSAVARLRPEALKLIEIVDFDG